MEHDQKPTHDQTESQSEDQPDHEPDGRGMTILKIVAGIIVLFLAAVALVFGVCLMAMA